MWRFWEGRDDPGEASRAGGWEERMTLVIHPGQVDEKRKMKRGLIL